MISQSKYFLSNFNYIRRLNKKYYKNKKHRAKLYGEFFKNF